MLCDSIRYTSTLQDLNLSYNSINRSGAISLGSALLVNKSLRNLNISNNGIDAVGCFTVCVGVRENKTLKSLILDGNPVGEEGGRIIVKLAASEGHRLDISSENCDFTISCGGVKLKSSSKNINTSLLYVWLIFHLNIIRSLWQPYFRFVRLL